MIVDRLTTVMPSSSYIIKGIEEFFVFSSSSSELQFYKLKNNADDNGCHDNDTSKFSWNETSNKTKKVFTASSSCSLNWILSNRLPFCSCDACKSDLTISDTINSQDFDFSLMYDNTY